MDVKWIKICTNIFDDEKILLIESMPDPDAIITIWFKLLCLAGKQNNHGVFMINDRIPFTDEMFATIFRRNVATVRMALKVFENFGMIEIVDGVVTIPNWEKHQSLDALEKRRKSDRERQQKRREEQKLLAAHSEEKSDSEDEKCHVTVTEQDNVTIRKPDNVTIHSENRIDKNRLDKNNIYMQNCTEESEEQNYFGVETVERFKKLWCLYPKKINRLRALEAYAEAIADGVTDDVIEQGIEAYKKHIVREKIIYRFVKAGDTFFRERSWTDDYSYDNITYDEQSKNGQDNAVSYDMELFESFANQSTLYDDSKEKQQ